MSLLFEVVLRDFADNLTRFSNVRLSHFVTASSPAALPSRLPSKLVPSYAAPVARGDCTPSSPCRSNGAQASPRLEPRRHRFPGPMSRTSACTHRLLRLSVRDA